MNTKTVIAWVVIIAIVAFGGWYILHNKSTDSGTQASTGTNTTTGDKGAEKGNLTLPVIGHPASTGDIVVDKPKVGETISSPVSVSGKAKGGWYFEATAPVIVVDTNGKVLGQGIITAQGDWMNATSTVPFTGSINFDGKTAAEGAIIFQNDNPSGLDTNAKYFAVPVFFK